MRGRRGEQMSAQILDRPAWNALSARQSEHAVGNDRARRFLPEIGPLAGFRDDTHESLEALANLIPDSGTLTLLEVDAIQFPSSIAVLSATPGVQMMAAKSARASHKPDSRIVKLSASDIPEMMSLTSLTKPGPFEAGTLQLGDFWGIKESDRLVAMAGERMKHHGFTEVSGVCVHPMARGRGYARMLSTVVAAHILDRGETPYLHAYAANAAAISLYESLGFRVRCNIHVMIVARNELSASSPRIKI